MDCQQNCCHRQPKTHVRRLLPNVRSRPVRVASSLNDTTQGKTCRQTEWTATANVATRNRKIKHARRSPKGAVTVVHHALSVTWLHVMLFAHLNGRALLQALGHGEPHLDNPHLSPHGREHPPNACSCVAACLDARICPRINAHPGLP